jgi:signal recognition particle subunit SRP68
LVVLQAKTIYEQLSSTLSEEESALYRGRIDEIIPSLRYCAYNIGDASARQDLLNMSRGSNPFMNEDRSFKSMG